MGLGLLVGLGLAGDLAVMAGDEPELVPPLVLALPENSQHLPPEDEAQDKAEAESEPERRESVKVTPQSLEELGRWVTGLARRHLPHKFRDDRKWGGTTRRWDGVKFDLDGLRLDTERRWKEVNHGEWRRYEVQLLDPQREFVIALRRLETDERGRLKMTVDVSSAVRVHGRVAKWNRGVQLYSIGADARAKLQTTLDLTLEVAFLWTQVPPVVVFKPTIDRAQLRLVDFELDRIGEIGGDLAEGIGKAARGWLEDELKDQEQKLVFKLQRAIDRRRDDLRVSVSEFIGTEWGKLVARQTTSVADGGGEASGVPAG